MTNFMNHFHPGDKGHQLSWRQIFYRGLVCLILLGSFSSQGWANDFNVAFYYGANPPFNELQAFQVVVVDPGHKFAPLTYRTKDSELFAYVSLGELESSRPYSAHVPQEWVKGKNQAWQSLVIDQTVKGWPEFVTKQIIGPLWEQGYRGFFLDTLDSYRLIAHTEEDRREQEAGLIRVIQRIKAQFPEAKLIFNRGFELLPAVGTQAYALAAESLYHGWNQATKQYVEVSEEDRQWLLGQLATVQQTYHLPVIIIDYLPPKERQASRALAHTIQDLNMIPWISVPELNMLGIGGVEVIPRKVLTLFDGSRDALLGHSELHRFIDMPLNHLGYVPEPWDVSHALPDFPLVGRYAGIVAWLPENEAEWSSVFHQWLIQHIRQGIRVALFSSLGFPIQPPYLTPLGLATEELSNALPEVHFSHQDPSIGFEIQPLANRRTFTPLTVLEGNPLLSLGSTTNQRQDVVAYTAWGGYALAPYAVVQLPDLESFRWVIDPIQFLRNALVLPPMPVPDTTTENGRRILMVHIDGDGFPSVAEFPGKPYAGAVMLDKILRRYQVPTTVSIIEGEIGSTGLYPKLAETFEKIARQIFVLPHVEIASHSFSHPFNWREFRTKGASQPGQYHLAVPNYPYGTNNLQREIQGSIQYINTHLAPPDKQVKVFLWTGDCDPPSAAVAITDAIQVGNMNGGQTIITKGHNSLTAVAPLGIKKGQTFQIYAPNQNENIYTNNWLGPYYGFQQVIETFQLTDHPRRLKPINIYYHTYSATKQASLTALHKVYQWALNQPVTPLYVSEYIQKVRDFNRAVITKHEDGWKLHRMNALREFRIPQSMGYPDLQRSQGVVGFSDHEQDRYLHLSGKGPSTVFLSPDPPTQPFLINTNGHIISWKTKGRVVGFQLLSAQPLVVRLANVHICRITAPKALVQQSTQGATLSITITKPSTNPIGFLCKSST